MEKKEELKEKLKGCIADYSDLDGLVEVVEKELDRAREEGRREYARELLDDYYQPDSDSIEIDVSEIQSELSKLTIK